jgi:hypothetical protein
MRISEANGRESNLEAAGKGLSRSVNHRKSAQQKTERIRVKIARNAELLEAM